MSDFIELQENGRAKVFIQRSSISYVTPYTKEVNEAKTIIYIKGGTSVVVDQDYEKIKSRLTNDF